MQIALWIAFGLFCIFSGGFIVLVVYGAVVNTMQPPSQSDTTPPWPIGPRR